MYRLDHNKIIATVEMLNKRIEERFPKSGLAKVSFELLKIGREAQERCRWVASPHWELRIGIYFIIGVMVISFILAVVGLDLPHNQLTFSEFVQVLESGINDVVFIGAAVIFLITIENRVKRKRVLQLVHELRSLAHVVDMHQLTKDPQALLNRYQETASSPQRKMTAFELERYLDYCTEILSLIGKTGALYIQDFDDSAAVEAVNEIEVLTIGLSRKIWQKISIIQAYSKS